MIRAFARLAAASFAVALLASAPAAAQVADGRVPEILFRFEPAYEGLLAAGAGGDPAEDARWAQREAEPLTELVADDGARLLGALSDYAGVAWPYREIPVYLVRRLPTLSIQYPLTIAVGEIRQGESRQEVPRGDFLILTFAHQIAHYLLDPPPAELDANRPNGLDHPLMEEGNYRREALVNVVAYRALEDLWGRERLGEAIEEPLWASYNPEAAFVDSLRAHWSVSRSRPLVTWLMQEGPQGSLVALAERLESRGGAAEEGGEAGGTGVSGAGGVSGTEAGFDLGETAEGRLFIAFLDPQSPADAAGLRAGDIVLTIEGRRFGEPGEAMRVVREAWQRNREVNLSIERQGREVFFQIH